VAKVAVFSLELLVNRPELGGLLGIELHHKTDNLRLVLADVAPQQLDVRADILFLSRDQRRRGLLRRLGLYRRLPRAGGSQEQPKYRAALAFRNSASHALLMPGHEPRSKIFAWLLRP